MLNGVFVQRERTLRDDDAAGLRALLSQAPRKRSGVDVRDADDALLLQIAREVALRPEIRRSDRQIADHQTGRVNTRGLNVFVVDAGVADVRISERNDLPGVRRIRQDFLVTGHGSVENDLA